MKSLKKKGLHVKVVLIFSILALVTLGILWLVEMLFMDDAYNSIKANSITKQAEVISANIDNPEVKSLVERIAYTEEMSIIVVDPSGNTVCEAHSPYSPLADLDAESLGEYYTKAKQNSGHYLQKARSLVNSNSYDSAKFTGNVPENMSETKERYIAYSLIATTAGDDEYAVIVTAVFSNESRILLITSLLGSAVISVLFLIIGVVMIFVLSRSVVKPIEQLTDSARRLADGETDVTFEAKGFSEVEELSNVLNHTATELSTLDNLRKELIANVSHDLRTPLSLIKGYSELMRDIPSERQEENLQVVIDETERLTGLVNDMLNLSRIQNKDNELRPEDFDIIAEVKEVCLRLAKMLTAQGLTLDYKSTLRSATVYGDKDRLMQVVYNLLSNAINYIGEDRKIVLNIRRNGENVRIEVIDHGIGIDVNDLPHIWDRYYKSDRSHKRANIGTGLGLSIVKSVMSSHPGGVYGVETTKGFGSNFYIELPCSECVNNI